MRPQLEPIGEELPPKMPHPRNPSTKNGVVTVTITSIISILLSIPIILSGLYLAFNQPENSCIKILHWPLVLLGAVVSIIALFGLLGSICRMTWLVLVYFIAMSLAIVALGALVAFVYVVTNVKNSDDGAEFGALGGVDTYPSGDHSLDDFSSGWFRKRVEGIGKWDSIRECLSSTGVCSELDQRYHTAQDLLNSELSPIEEGCCKPPQECGYTFINATNWINPANTAGRIDCLLWSNNQTELCYQCSMCKAGFLASLRKQWRTVDFVLFVAFVGLISMYLFGCCCSIRRARMHSGRARDKHGDPRNGYYG